MIGPSARLVWPVGVAAVRTTFLLRLSIKRGMRADGVEMPATLDDDFVYRSRLDEVLASFEVKPPQSP
jgi:hypothetical protein